MWAIKRPNSVLCWNWSCHVWEDFEGVYRHQIEFETLLELEKEAKYVNDDFEIMWKN